MKIFMLIFVIFTLNAYVTGETSLDPLDHIEIDEAKNANEDVRNKRSGEFFSLLLKKKLGLLNSLTGVSSGKSIGGHPGVNPFDQHLHPFQHLQPPQPLSYHTKSFNLWGIKKAILSSVLQAAKAITGGVIAVKGQLIKAKGHAVVAKGKLLQTKGEAITNFGKSVATHAFDVHPQPQIDVQSAVGLFNHLPVTPVHQPAAYGVATALGYQGQPYPVNAYANSGYQMAGAGYPTGYAAAAPQAGYDAGSDYAGNGYTAKRAVQNVAQESSSINQVQSASSNHDSVRAGLLIFKPIKSPQTALPGSTPVESSQGQQQIFDRRPVQFPMTGNGLQNMFSGLQQIMSQSNGFQTGPSAVNGYQGSLTDGFSSFPVYKFPTTGGESGVEQSQEYGGGLQNFDFQQQPTTSLEFNRQLAAAASKFANHQQHVSSYSQEMNNYNGGGDDDQNHSASSPEEHVAQATYKHVVKRVEKPKSITESDDLASGFFAPTMSTYQDHEIPSGYTKKRSAPKHDDHLSAATASSFGANIVPLKYNDDSTNPEHQAKLKQTVQRFFSMLQKQRCESNHI